MVENKVVAHTREGQVVKGLTHDFDPERTDFHVLPAEGGGVPVRLRLDDLKALFFVRDWIGNRLYAPPSAFGVGGALGRRCVVTFLDGEVVLGFTPDYRPSAAGFTVFPADAEDNNERIFVVADAVRGVQFP